MAERRYTAEQRAVITHDGGHAVVSAVAGSGKTETLVARLRHLLKAVDPAHIAVVMFNKDAAADFRDRFEKRVGGHAPEIRTFNAMGQRIAARMVAAGHLPKAELVTREFRRTRLAKAALTDVYRRLNGADATPDRELVDSFVSFVGLVKSDVEAPEDVFEAGHYAQAAKGFPDAFHLYERMRLSQGLRFYEDQLYDPVMAMLRDPSLQTMVTDRLDHLVIDEAQDVNGIQIHLLKILAGERAKVMIVGDEDQSIYGWRGAKPDFITRTFRQVFPHAVRYTLPHTFRFGHAIALAANHVIGHNRDRPPKQSVSAPSTPLSEIHAHAIPRDDSGVGAIIARSNATGRSYSDIAVLVRTYDLAVSIEIDLFQRGIPYFVHGRAPLLSVPEISAMMGVLQLASGQWSAKLTDDERSTILRNVLSLPSIYLAHDALDGLVNRATRSPDTLAVLLRGLVTRAMKPYQVDQIRDRADSLAIVIDNTPADMTPGALLRQYQLTTNFEGSIRRQCATQEQADTILRNVTAFTDMASKHAGSIASFLDELDPLIGTEEQTPPEGPYVWISSIHRAKGAEWPEVIVPGLANGAFPSERGSADIAAERRLFYVAITRAREHLHLMHPACPTFAIAKRAIGFDGTGINESTVSPFVWEAQIALSAHAAACVDDPVSFQSEAVRFPTVANAYLAAQPHAAHCSYSQLPPPPPKPTRDTRAGSTQTPGDPRLNQGVRLKIDQFGTGTVQEWMDQRIVRVAFDNGDSRLFVANMFKFTLL